MEKLTPEAEEQLKGLDAKRAAMKANGQRVLQLGQSHRETESRVSAEKARRVEMQEYLNRDAQAQFVFATSGRLDSLEA